MKAEKFKFLLYLKDKKEREDKQTEFTIFLFYKRFN